MKLEIVTSPTRPSTEITVPDDATVADLKKTYKPHVSIHRKMFRLDKVVLSDAKKLSDYGIKDGGVRTVSYKDLGPQVGYRTVFVVEYAGPIAIMALLSLRPALIYGPSSPISNTTTLANISMFVLHFVKRELETFFVHKFSRPTMPLSNIVKNSVYYWSFAAFIGYFLCHPLYTPASSTSLLAGGAIMGISEILNFAVHYQLSTMRKAEGDQSRDLPTGPLFARLSSPNYTFEVMSWVGFSISSGIAASWFFTAVGLAQMSDWALKKQRGYAKDAKSDAEKSVVRRRKAIIPFVL